MSRLTAITVKNAKPGRHGDGGGLYLVVQPSGARSWILRVQRDGRRRDIGLGSLAATTLSEARQKAAELRRHALNGRDPIAERDKDRRPTPTFKQATLAAHAALKAGWIEKNAAAFLSSLEANAFPALANLQVDTISAGHIRDMLAPIWIAKPELARKVRMRVGQVLNFAHSKGWRTTEMPSRSVTVGLPKQPKGGNFKAMPYRDAPAFLRQLLDAELTSGRAALIFLMLTGARGGEVRGATWEQIDFGTSSWHRPAALMKGSGAGPHTVTLNEPATALLRHLEARKLATADVIFPSPRGGKLSDMALNKVISDSGLPFDPHGFRSTFRDWAAEQMPEIPDPVAEAALAHAVPDKVVRAYKRTTFLEMRKELLNAWGEYLTQGRDNAMLVAD